MAGVFLILASVASPTKDATVFAQNGAPQCDNLSAIRDQASEALNVARQKDEIATETIANLLASMIRANREVDALRDQIAHYETLEVFTSAGSPASVTIQRTLEKLQSMTWVERSDDYTDLPFLRGLRSEACHVSL